MNDILNIKNLSKKFDQKFIIHAVNLSIKYGEIACILGPSGSGKTTLLNLIAGFEKIDSGEILLRNRLVSSSNINLMPSMRKIGYVYQTPSLWPHMNAFENVAFPLRVTKTGSELIHRQVTKLFDLTNMLDFKHYLPHELSLGQQQRISILRSIILKPDLILFDEPLSSLDVGIKEEILRFIYAILKEFNIAAVYVTHDINEAIRIADKITICHNKLFTDSRETKAFLNYPVNYIEAKFNPQGFIIKTKVETLIDINKVVVNYLGTKFIVKKLSLYKLSVGDGCEVFIKYRDIKIYTSSRSSCKEYIKFIVTDSYPTVDRYSIILSNTVEEIKVYSHKALNIGSEVSIQIKTGLFLLG